jgi:hypothetical protein
VADGSIGLSGAAWRLLSSPTPGAANAVPATLGAESALRINEWMARPGSGPDWFELFNTSANPVDLTGLTLTDDLSVAGNGNTVLGPLSFIGAGDFTRFEADGSPSEGLDHVRFSLDGQGEAIRLYGLNGSVLDTVYLGAQIPGVSEGRLPDGGSTLVLFDTTATPGSSNYLPLDGVVVNEVLTHTDPPQTDTIELYNTTGGDLDVGGWFLSDAGDYRKYAFPAGTVIPTGGYLTVDESDFNATADARAFALNSAHGDAVRLVEADTSGNLLRFVDYVDFGAAARMTDSPRKELNVNGTRDPVPPLSWFS